jgi:hypothetical protein
MREETCRQPWQDPDLWTCPVNPHLMYIWCNIYLFIYAGSWEEAAPAAGGRGESGWAGKGCAAGWCMHAGGECAHGAGRWGQAGWRGEELIVRASCCRKELDSTNLCANLPTPMYRHKVQHQH